MMLKVNDDYLDFTDLVEVEKQIKLFEDIATTDGDFSYAFDLPKTINNLRTLGNPQPDNINKQVYQRIPAILMTDGGEQTFKGYLRVEKLTNVITCSFFAGNNNWFGLLSDSMRSLDWSEYDLDLTESNVAASIFNTSGLVYPFLDNGMLRTRGTPLIKLEDLVGGIHVKDAFNKIFSSHGIKIQGELLDDPNFNTAVVLSNPRNEQLIYDRSAFVGKSTPQMVDFDGSTTVQITFDDQTTPPFFNGGNFNLATESYTSDIRQVVRVELFLSCQQVVSDSVRFLTKINLNGVEFASTSTNNPPTELFTVNLTARVPLVAGDVIDFSVTPSVFEVDTMYILEATVKITPLFVYRSVGESSVPDWTQQQYVSNIIRLFGVLPHYDGVSKTLTLNLFQKIKDKTPINISEHISGTEVDYSEFISEYGKQSLFSYQETADDDITTNFFGYSKGAISVDNEFLDDSVDVLTSDFSQPIGYLNNVFDMSMEKLDFIEVEEDVEVEITGVTDVSDRARFAVEEDEFQLSDLVRVHDSTNRNYNGDYMVSSVGAGYIELSGVDFSTDARAKVTRLVYKYSSSDNVFLVHHVPLYTVNKFSGLNEIKLENTGYETFTLGFFNLLNTGRQVNRDFIYSLSFSGEGHPLHYQQTLIDQYFSLFARVLNDPVKLYCTCTLPYYLFSQIDFLSPVVIRTEESQNVYYLNRITGYKEGYLDCVTELIKLP